MELLIAVRHELVADLASPGHLVPPDLLLEIQQSQRYRDASACSRVLADNFRLALSPQLIPRRSAMRSQRSPISVPMPGMVIGLVLMLAPKFATTAV